MKQNEQSIIDINFNKLHKKKPISSTYCLSSYKNLYSNIDFEKTMLFTIYKMFKSFLKSSSPSISFREEISSEALAILKYCSFKLYGYYEGYTTKSVLYDGLFLNPPSKYIKYNDDGVIDPWESERLPVTVSWCCIEGFVTITYPESKEFVEDSSDFDILKSLALINPFFACMKDEELNEIIKSINY